LPFALRQNICCCKKREERVQGRDKRLMFEEEEGEEIEEIEERKYP
jgi:hypothetical protein